MRRHGRDEDVGESIEWIQRFWETSNEREKAEALMTIHEIMPNVIEYPPEEHVCQSCGRVDVLGPRMFQDSGIVANNKDGEVWKVKQVMNDDLETKAYCPDCNAIEEQDRNPDISLIEEILSEMGQDPRHGDDFDDDDSWNINLE